MAGEAIKIIRAAYARDGEAMKSFSDKQVAISLLIPIFAILVDHIGRIADSMEKK